MQIQQLLYGSDQSPSLQQSPLHRRERFVLHACCSKRKQGSGNSALLGLGHMATKERKKKKQEFFFIDNKRAPKTAGFRHSASWEICAVMRAWTQALSHYSTPLKRAEKFWAQHM